jgi:hypothetical protein
MKNKYAQLLTSVLGFSYRSILSIRPGTAFVSRQKLIVIKWMNLQKCKKKKKYLVLLFLFIFNVIVSSHILLGYFPKAFDSQVPFPTSN